MEASDNKVAEQYIGNIFRWLARIPIHFWYVREVIVQRHHQNNYINSSNNHQQGRNIRISLLTTGQNLQREGETVFSVLTH